MFVLGATLLVFGLLTFSPLLSVRQIRIARSDARIDVEHIERLLAPMFRRHLFFLSSQEVVSLLKDAVPDISAATVTKRYPSTLIVRLTLDPIIARLLIEEPRNARPAAPVRGSGSAAPSPTPSGEYLTSQGLYVTYTPSQVQGAPPMPLRIVDWGARPVPWTSLIEPDYLLAMRETEKALLDQFGQEVIERTIFLRAREFHLRTKTITLWFDRRSTLEEHLRRYRIFLRTIGLDAAKEYVDLRLNDRIVYK